MSKGIDLADIQELHERGYSLYESIEENRRVLDELHSRNYQIFDERGTELLHEVFNEEFCRLAGIVSFVSLQNMAKTGNLWPQTKEKPDKAVKKKLAEIIGSLLRICS